MKLDAQARIWDLFPGLLAERERLQSSAESSARMESRSEPPDSPDHLWGEILRALNVYLPSILERRLRFARPHDVAALVMTQVQWSGPERHVLNQRFGERPSNSKEYQSWLREKAEEIITPLPPYIDHCELVAEYRNSSTSEQRQAVIRELFRAETGARICSFVEAVLENRGCANPGDTTIERICLKVRNRLFGQVTFGNVAAKYRCAKGMTFERYLLRKGLFLVHDEVGAFFETEPDVRPIDDDGRIGTPGQSRGGQGEAEDGEADETQHNVRTDDNVETDDFPLSTLPGNSRSGALDVANAAATRLREVVARIRDRVDSDRHVALVFLYFKTYVEPDVIPRRVAQQVGGGKSRLQRDYEAAQCALRQLREEFAETAANVDSFDSQLRRKAWELRSRFGVRDDGLVALELTARRSAIGEMEKVLGRMNPVRDAQRVCEIDYMLAYKRIATAQAAYEKACVCLRRYNDYMKPWVRSQKELAELLRAPQGTIGRELAEMRAALRSLASSSSGPSCFEGEQYAE